MKATLEFDLPDDKYEFKMALLGSTYAAVVVELDQHLRWKVKYDEDLPEAHREVLDGVRTRLWEILNAYDLDPYAE